MKFGPLMFHCACFVWLAERGEFNECLLKRFAHRCAW